MSGRLIPFRGARATAAASRPADTGSGPRGLVSEDPAGAAAPFPRPFGAPRFRELVSPHIDAAYSLARYLSRNDAAAEDIAQEALLKAFRNLETLRGDAVRPWLLAIVRNSYFDWRRRQDGRAVGGEAAEIAYAQAADDAPSAEASLIRQGDVAALRSAIEAIPEPFREALVLRDLEELSYREVAEVTGVPMGTVMSRLARARRMLAERMGVTEVVA
ncbi:MAG TPA: sigma-70 family RNA polymerase sigma factor [Caulobacteraceae bacterium]|jgi:RNA polymerase sigma-70 factor (ECF subfamily)